MKFIFTLLITTLLVPVHAKRLDKEQRKELFVEGTITTEKETYDIRFIPGTVNIKEDAKEAFEDAGDAMKKLGKKDFYQEAVVENFKDGVEFAFEDSWGDYWWDGIVEDTEKAGKVLGSPDTFGGVVGKGVGATWWLIKVVGRTGTAPFGTVLGLGYSVVAPTVVVGSKPVSAIWNVGVEGVAVPGALYAWNGTAWVLTFMSKEPKNADGWLVRVATKKVPKTPLVLTMTDAQNLLEGVMSKEVVEQSLLPQTTKADELRKEAYAIEDEVRGVRNEYRRSKANVSFRSIMDKSYRRKVTASDEAQAVLLDEGTITKAISAYLHNKEIDDKDGKIAAKMLEEYQNVVKRLLTER